MSARIIDGEAVARELRDEVRAAVQGLSRRGIQPGLAGVLVGDNPASLSYIRGKTKACAEAGILFELFQQPADATADSVFGMIAGLNADARFHGILVQQPLPPHLDTDAVQRAVSPEKDVDGLHPYNAGLLLQGAPSFVPCTPAGIQELLVRGGHDPAGKSVVIVGRSNLVGKPLAALLMQRVAGANATVTICHSATRDLADHTRRADILVAAIGVPRFIKADMVADGAIVIDVGINRAEDASRRSGYRLVGDIDFEPVAEKAGAITPVPGGVGPMTVAMLLVNTLRSAEQALARSAPERATG